MTHWPKRSGRRPQPGNGHKRRRRGRIQLRSAHRSVARGWRRAAAGAPRARGSAPESATQIGGRARFGPRTVLRWTFDPAQWKERPADTHLLGDAATTVAALRDAPGVRDPPASNGTARGDAGGMPEEEPAKDGGPLPAEGGINAAVARRAAGRRRAHGDQFAGSTLLRSCIIRHATPPAGFATRRVATLGVRTYRWRGRAAAHGGGQRSRCCGRRRLMFSVQEKIRTLWNTRLPVQSSSSTTGVPGDPGQRQPGIPPSGLELRTRNSTASRFAWVRGVRYPRRDGDLNMNLVSGRHWATTRRPHPLSTSAERTSHSWTIANRRHLSLRHVEFGVWGKSRATTQSDFGAGRRLAQCCVSEPWPALVQEEA